MATRRRSRVIFIERELYTSEAYLSLKGIAPQLLLIFLGKRQMENNGEKGRQKWVCKNNGKIEFTYLEAEKNYGISKKRFAKGIDELIENGFIEITEKGGAYQRHKTKYWISDRWKDHEKADFIKASRPKDKVQRGYCRPKKKADSAFSTSQEGTHTRVPEGNSKVRLKAV